MSELKKPNQPLEQKFEILKKSKKFFEKIPVMRKKRYYEDLINSEPLSQVSNTSIVPILNDFDKLKQKMYMPYCISNQTALVFSNQKEKRLSIIDIQNAFLKSKKTSVKFYFKIE